MFQNEALNMKESLKDSSLDSFRTSNGWLENWKAVYGIRGTRSKVLNAETANSDLEDENESQESSLSSIITLKEALSLPDKVHLLATYNENNDLQHSVDDIITTIEGINTRAKEQATITDFFLW